MTTAVIVQARTGSQRFPNKVLASLAGRPVLEHVLSRAKQIAQTILAVPYNDHAPTEIAARLDVPVVYGSEHDVLKRYFQAAKAYHIDIIMRITADCPLIDVDLCKKTLRTYLDSRADYAAIGWPRTYPQGYGCEVFSKQVLIKAHRLANSAEDREHVTPWIERNCDCVYLMQDKDESHLNYCVDYPEDINRLEKILAADSQISRSL